MSTEQTEQVDPDAVVRRRIAEVIVNAYFAGEDEAVEPDPQDLDLGGVILGIARETTRMPLEVLKLQAGDRVILRYNGRLTLDEMARARQQVRADLGPDVPFIVVDDAFNVSVLRQGQDREAS